MSEITLISPATSANLGPGFDALGLSLALFNEVGIKRAKAFSLAVEGEGKGLIDSENLFLRIFYEELACYLGLNEGPKCPAMRLDILKEKQPFAFSFKNAIPLSRGLGSSSSVVVAAVSAARHFAKDECSQKILDKQELLNAALKYETHPDNIAPCMLGGFVSSVVKDSFIYCQKTAMNKDYAAVVAIPKQPVSTKESRKALPKSLSLKKCVHALSHAALLTACFTKQDFSLAKIASEDLLHQNARMQAFPELFSLQKMAFSKGALLSTLSGSGPSFFNLVRSKDAESLKTALESAFSAFKIIKLDFDNEGLRAL